MIANIMITNQRTSDQNHWSHLLWGKALRMLWKCLWKEKVQICFLGLVHSTTLLLEGMLTSAEGQLRSLQADAPCFTAPLLRPREVPMQEQTPRAS